MVCKRFTIHAIGVLEHAFPELSFLERHKRLTEGRLTKTLKIRTDRKMHIIEGKQLYIKLLDKYKIAKT